MINQSELLERFAKEIAAAKKDLFQECSSYYELHGTEQGNAHFNAHYKKTQNALMDCIKILLCAKYEIDNN